MNKLYMILDEIIKPDERGILDIIIEYAQGENLVLVTNSEFLFYNPASGELLGRKPLPVAPFSGGRRDFSATKSYFVELDGDAKEIRIYDLKLNLLRTIFDRRITMCLVSEDENKNLCILFVFDTFFLIKDDKVTEIKSPMREFSNMALYQDKLILWDKYEYYIKDVNTGKISNSEFNPASNNNHVFEDDYFYLIDDNGNLFKEDMFGSTTSTKITESTTRDYTVNVGLKISNGVLLKLDIVVNDENRYYEITIYNIKTGKYKTIIKRYNMVYGFNMDMTGNFMFTEHSDGKTNIMNLETEEEHLINFNTSRYPIFFSSAEP